MARTTLSFVVAGPWGDLSNYYTDGTNDHTELQLALNRLNTLGGGEILLLKSTYNLGAGLTTYSNLGIRGLGINATIIKLNSGINADGLAGTNISNFYVRDLQINANSAGQKYKKWEFSGKGYVNEDEYIKADRFYKSIQGKVIATDVSDIERGAAVDGNVEEKTPF